MENDNHLSVCFMWSFWKEIGLENHILRYD